MPLLYAGAIELCLAVIVKGLRVKRPLVYPLVYQLVPSAVSGVSVNVATALTPDHAVILRGLSVNVPPL